MIMKQIKEMKQMRQQDKASVVKPDNLVRTAYSVKTVRMEGALTVESVFIVPLIIALIILVIYLNFYLHDKVVLESNVCLQMYNWQENEYKVKKRMSEGLWISEIEDIKIDSGNNKLQVLWDIEFPGISKRLTDAEVYEQSNEVRAGDWDMAEIRRFITVGEDAVMTIPGVKEFIEKWIK